VAERTGAVGLGIMGTGGILDRFLPGAAQAPSIDVVGSAGSLRLGDPFAGRATRLVGSDGFVADIPKVDPYELELEDLAGAIRGEHPPRLGRADAVGQARTLRALYESAAEGRLLPV